MMLRVVGPLRFDGHVVGRIIVMLQQRLPFHYIRLVYKTGSSRRLRVLLVRNSAYCGAVQSHVNRRRKRSKSRPPVRPDDK
jgi:hypothetical protein